MATNYIYSSSPDEVKPKVILQTSILSTECLDVAWTWPTDRNSEIYELLIQYKLENSDVWVDMMVTAEVRNLLILGVTPNAAYQVRVIGKKNSFRTK